MNIFDVVYTPLDTPPMPEVDVPKLINWIEENHSKLKPQTKVLNDTDLIADEKYGNSYPWKFTPIYLDTELISTGWLGDFNTIFPELSNYFYTAFGLELEDLGCVVLLPTFHTHTGLGFWHQDVDKVGLRMYLEFDDFENKLLVRKTKTKLNSKLDHNDPSLEDILQSEIIDCNILHKNQCFFLNNVNAAHNIYTAVPGKIRIAALIAEKGSNQDIILTKIESLVVNSAKKFSDYSIIW